MTTKKDVIARRATEAAPLICLLRHEVHLTLVAPEVEAEATAIAQPQVQRLVPFRLPTATPHTEPELLTDTITALHDDALRRLLRLQGGSDLGEPMLRIERTRCMVRHII